MRAPCAGRTRRCALFCIGVTLCAINVPLGAVWRARCMTSNTYPSATNPTTLPITTQYVAVKPRNFHGDFFSVSIAFSHIPPHRAKNVFQ